MSWGVLASPVEHRSRTEQLILLDSADVLEKIPVGEGFQLQGCEIELKRKLDSALNHSLS